MMYFYVEILDGIINWARAIDRYRLVVPCRVPRVTKVQRHYEMEREEGEKESWRNSQNNAILMSGEAGRGRGGEG